MIVTASATIERGVKTNRVRVKKDPKPRRRSQPKRYRADPTRGAHPDPAIATKSPTKVIGVSMTVEELAELDAAAERVQMSRSAFLRRAYKHFMARIFDGGGQEQRWRDALRAP